MKHTLYAVVAATLAMFATSGIVALATAAPEPEPELQAVEAELVEHLDSLIAAQLAKVKQRVLANLPR